MYFFSYSCIYDNCHKPYYAYVKLAMTQTNNNKKPFPKVPDEAIVKPEEEKPTETAITPEEVDSKDEAEYEQMKSADYDMDGDDNPDLDPEV